MQVFQPHPSEHAPDETEELIQILEIEVQAVNSIHPKKERPLLEFNT
jgi:hypothetical protein